MLEKIIVGIGDMLSHAGSLGPIVKALETVALVKFVSEYPGIALMGLIAAVAAIATVMGGSKSHT